MAEIEIPVVDAIVMQSTGHPGQAPDQMAFLLQAWRLLGPGGAMVFQADAVSERLSNQKGALLRRVEAFPAIGHRHHGVNAQGRQPMDGAPFVACAQHRQLEVQQILKNLPPANALMAFDEKALA